MPSSCVIEPARHTLTVQAQLFLERLQAEVAHIQKVTLARGARA